MTILETLTEILKREFIDNNIVATNFAIYITPKPYGIYRALDSKIVIKDTHVTIYKDTMLIVDEQHYDLEDPNSIINIIKFLKHYP